jgi:hypothetical protein
MHMTEMYILCDKCSGGSLRTDDAPLERVHVPNFILPNTNFAIDMERII